MYLSKMLGLPPSLLVLLTAATQSFAQHPTALRKMSLDEGEKFMPHYYVFGPAASPLNARAAEEELLLSGNSSAAIPFLPPYPRHYDYQGTGLGARVGEGGRSQEKSREEDSGSSSQLLYRRMREVLSKLQGRQFACPQGTHSCTNIDQPNYCCTTGTTCFVVTNAPNAGNVGCCPDGNNCGVTVGLCTDGSTACPANVGGGCCIPGFVCADIGCKFLPLLREAKSAAIDILTSENRRLEHRLGDNPIADDRHLDLYLDALAHDAGHHRHRDGDPAWWRRAGY